MMTTILRTIVFVLIFFTATRAWETSLSTVKQAFYNAKIPQDTNIPFNPKVLYQVFFPTANGGKVYVNTGETIFINQTANAPQFSIDETSVKNLGTDDEYVIAAIDPDAPFPDEPFAAQVRHFLGGGFKLQKDFRSSNGLISLVNTTPAISDWLQPGPPLGSPPHRYTFFLFKQPLDFSKQTLINSTTDILGFNLSSFVDAVGLGAPLGGSFVWIGPDANSQPIAATQIPSGITIPPGIPIATGSAKFKF